MKRKSSDFKCTGAMVLGMHDALVSLTGTIAGLAFALTERKIIILTAVIAAVVASLSMSASSYLAERANESNNAKSSAIYTGFAYLITSALLILPFVVLKKTSNALIFMFIIAIAIIFGFNTCIGITNKKPFVKKFLEMLFICSGVSIIAFIIGQIAKIFLGLTIF